MLLVFTNRPQVRQNGSLQSISIIVIHTLLDVVLVHSEVLQILEVALVAIGNHPIQHLLESFSLECTINEDETRRTSVLSQFHHTRNHRSIKHARQQHISIQVHIDRILVQILFGERFMPQIERKFSHSSESENTRVSESHRRISVSNSEILLRHIVVLDNIVVAGASAFILAVISKNERIIDGEPGLSSGRGKKSGGQRSGLFRWLFSRRTRRESGWFSSGFFSRRNRRESGWFSSGFFSGFFSGLFSRRNRRESGRNLSCGG